MNIDLFDTDQAIAAIKNYLKDLQDRISSAFAAEDGGADFVEDHWTYAQGGGGCSRALSEGAVFEKTGVNFSHVLGNALPPTATANRPELKDCTFQALGVSVVAHPLNPYAPTSHANIRFFIAEPPEGPPIWWFGGGFDLTPYYGFIEDCQHWHQMAKKACDPFGDEVYATYKAWCDRYFYLKHRNEPRGIGGLFFDDLNSWQGELNFEQSFAFMRSVGDHYLSAYQPLIARRKEMAYTARERDFQLYRRGRYVEFNLLWDRGTIFGIQSGGRTESILMSLPPQVTWRYQWQPEPGSAEERLYQEFLIVREWL